MNSKPLVTVVVTTYNQEKYLGDCLKALVEDLSSLSCEIIVADDCSQDSTADVAHKFRDKYPNLIKVIVRDKNIGANMNYVSAHAMAKGDFVAHMDGDDIAVSGKFKKQIRVLEDNPSVSFVVHAAEYFDDSGDVIKTTGIFSQSSKLWFFDSHDLAAWGPISVHSSFMYRRTALSIEEIPIPFMEWMIAMNVLSRGVGVFINESLVRYRYNLNGSAWTASSKGRQNAYEIQWKNVSDTFDKYPNLRVYLYAQVLVNAIGIIKANAKITSSMTRFIISKIRHFRFGLFFNAITMRFALSPRHCK